MNRANRNKLKYRKKSNYLDDWRFVASFIRNITRFGKIEPEMWARKHEKHQHIPH